MEPESKEYDIRERKNVPDPGNLTPYTASREMTIVDDETKDEDNRIRYEQKKTMGGFKRLGSPVDSERDFDVDESISFKGRIEEDDNNYTDPLAIQTSGNTSFHFRKKTHDQALKLKTPVSYASKLVMSNYLNNT